MEHSIVLRHCAQRYTIGHLEQGESYNGNGQDSDCPAQDRPALQQHEWKKEKQKKDAAN
jgi:hypothetical protein